MAAAATTSSMAATAVFSTRLTTNCSALPYLPPPRLSTSSAFSSISLRKISDAKRTSLLRVKASEDSSAVDTSELLSDLKEKWDAVENKSTVIIYGGGAIVAVWLASIVVGAVNSVPLLPKILELVGLGYTGWFVYRYLLFKGSLMNYSPDQYLPVGCPFELQSSRKELASDIEALKKKIAGTE
ncbi:OLC1v1038451C1 [Oldenlandia corymbosa var. corymbosa]|uniref:OLC1v1038451C1 n=1 Tax=Oldenlandia corymbosa var. corymbosa TaxID=529605 RepID=A0AAV1D014_OLDCO|nr:OLC1v1038451C1 [Oldenlandia corymbosa var. corymbosa]